jgi:hypothetical protein
MQPRRSLRLVAGALVLALPLLSSCGFSKATDRVYTPGEGTNNRDGQVDVLAAVVVAAQPDSGTFIASLSNNSTTDDTFEGLEGAGDWADLQIGEVSPPVDVPARGLVNLADEGGVAITGDFAAGDMMRVSLTFGSGQTTTLNVPVVFACDEYTGLDSSRGGGLSASPQTDESESPSPGEVPTDGASSEASATDGSESPGSTESSSPSADADSYDCAAAHGEG